MSHVDKECRICLESDDLSDIIVPCHCNGTIKYIHRKCLDKWRLTCKIEDIDKCPQCNFKYITEESSKNNFILDKKIFFMKCLIFFETFFALLLTQLFIILISIAIYNNDPNKVYLDNCPKDFTEKLCYYAFGNIYFFAVIGFIALIFYTTLICIFGSKDIVVVICNNNTNTILMMSKIILIIATVCSVIIGFNIFIVCFSVFFNYIVDIHLSKYGRLMYIKKKIVKNLEDTERECLV